MHTKQRGMSIGFPTLARGIDSLDVSQTIRRKHGALQWAPRGAPCGHHDIHTRTLNVKQENVAEASERHVAPSAPAWFTSASTPTTEVYTNPSTIPHPLLQNLLQRRKLTSFYRDETNFKNSKIWTGITEKWCLNHAE